MKWPAALKLFGLEAFPAPVGKEPDKSTKLALAKVTHPLGPESKAQTEVADRGMKAVFACTKCVLEESETYGGNERGQFDDYKVQYNATIAAVKALPLKTREKRASVKSLGWVSYLKSARPATQCSGAVQKNTTKSRS